MTTQRTAPHRTSLTSDVVGRRIRTFLDDRSAVAGRSRRERICPELVEAGWQTFDGSLTISGARLRADLATDPATLHIAAQDAWTHRQGWIRVGATRALAVVQVPGTHVKLQTMSTGALPLFLATWAGLNPIVTTGESYLVGDAGAVTRRVWDRNEPLPEGSAPRLAQLWARTWRQWSVSREETGAELSAISIEGAGHFVARANDHGQVALCERPGSLLWGDVQALVAALPSGALFVDPDDAAHW